ncbi:MAG: peptide chain release factor N(5)-glutamine methyltransferase [Myxococcota bacterium]|nr:peptide chain release factor N(5)-glutamine methyltransferase [Myxococcota bacterium]
MSTVKDILLRTAEFLAERGVDQPRLEAELLLGHALDKARMDLYLSFDQPLVDTELAALRPLVRRRANREPLYWILGRKGFHDIELLCHSAVLVPRSDTEALVEAVLQRLPTTFDGFVADVGSGTGALGLALAAARPGIKVYATDVSPAALANTRANVAALGLSSRVGVLEGPLLTPVPAGRPIDIVVSNPPYIPSDHIARLDAEVGQHEPRLALDGGRDGLDIYRALLPRAARRARIGVAVEIGHDQGPAVADLFRRAGLADVQVLPDLAGRDRVVLGRNPASRWPREPPVPHPASGERTVEPVAPAPVAAPGAEAVVVLDTVPDTSAVDERGQPLPVFIRD